MLFNSIDYFLIFLPCSIFVYLFFLNKRLFIASKVCLLFCSIFFYCYWKFDYIWILFASIVFNFTAGTIFSQLHKKEDKDSVKKILLTICISVNIASLAYYKYTDFFIADINLIFDTNISQPHILLPLAISFFTFQQIGYLVDSYRGLTKEYDFLSYALFVSFFPQLIAGPIVHHKDLIPQFYTAKCLHVNYKNMNAGLFIFVIGLVKKAIIADHFAIWVGIGFSNSSDLNIVTSWVTSVCYTFQLYFDFSGYCDMAVGSALFFNIRLPINFNSPYKALSIQDFWRRWHITLSSFLRDYLYFPLGGSRKGNLRTYLNLFILFLITGVWHGAGNMFILWGLANGIAIIIHRIFHLNGFKLPKIPAWILTFLFVNAAWVLFRAPNVEIALNIYKAMFDFTNISDNIANYKTSLSSIGFSDKTIRYVLAGFVVVIFMKNSNELLAKFESIKITQMACMKNLVSRYLLCFVVSFVMFFIIISVISSNYTEFIYFNF